MYICILLNKNQISEFSQTFYALNIFIKKEPLIQNISMVQYFGYYAPDKITELWTKLTLKPKQNDHQNCCFNGWSTIVRVFCIFFLCFIRYEIEHFGNDIEMLSTISPMFSTISPMPSIISPMLIWFFFYYHTKLCSEYVCSKHKRLLLNTVYMIPLRIASVTLR